jgi:hypothetical protein
MAGGAIGIKRVSNLFYLIYTRQCSSRSDPSPSRCVSSDSLPTYTECVGPSAGQRMRMAMATKSGS